MKETLRDRVRATLAATPGQTNRELVIALEASESAVRTATAGLQQSGEVVGRVSTDPKARKGEKLRLYMTDVGLARMVEHGRKARPITAASARDVEGYGEEDAPNPYQGSCVPTFVRGTASFRCELRGATITHADCYDDHLNAEAYERKTSPCYRCKVGAEKRSAYADA